MSDLLSEKKYELAQEMGWTQQRAQGYVDGEAAQRSGQDLSAFQRVAMDEYSQGFRTGYYTQACSLSIWNIRESLVAR